ncbi:class I SAM-dependent methyltransferase [Sorangium cellulosum]|uniref:class I SAM-dependent methyltransferase n=1 Tax=Sorangium TaxID=39643 RepID=UPI0009D66308|nr:class I SAM-dependent methyltransferase [Sorangium cellulosum]
METTAYQQYSEESGDWLRKGRARLLAHLVREFAPARRPLELLEVGAGVGQNLSVLAEFGAVDANEVSPLGQEAIARTGAARTLYSASLPFELDQRYDVICALDVIEHIEDDRASLRWIHDHLSPGGIFVATVPAYPWLFSDHDRALQHFRRYTAGSFRAALPADFQVEACAYFNQLLFPAAVGSRAVWSAARRLRPGKGSMKQPSPKSGLASTALEAVLGAEVDLIARGYRPRFGLSVFCVARRRPT